MNARMWQAASFGGAIPGSFECTAGAGAPFGGAAQEIRSCLS